MEGNALPVPPRDDEFTAEDLACRYEHFFTESEVIVPKAVKALSAGDMDEWGRQVDLSQIKASELLGNQVPETVHLAAAAKECGADAATAFGAGFGGSVWAMATSSGAAEFTVSPIASGGRSKTLLRGRRHEYATVTSPRA